MCVSIVVELQHFIVLTLFLLNDIFNLEILFLCIISFSVSLKVVPLSFLSLREEKNYIEFGVLKEILNKCYFSKKKYMAFFF